MNTFKKKLLLSSAILASSLSSTLVHAAPFASEARSLGMGGLGVVTADIATAPFTNPAMLSYQKFDEDFSVLLSGGFLLDDSNGMIDSIDGFQAASDQFNQSSTLDTDPTAFGSTVFGDSVQAVANFNQQIDATNSMNQAITALGGKALSPQVATAAVVGLAFEEYSIAFSARSDLVAAGGLLSTPHPTISSINNVVVGIDDATTLANINAAVADLNSLSGHLQTGTNNQLSLEGIQTTEIGLSMAKNFHIFGQKISIGITPKIINVQRTSFLQPVIDLDTGLSGLTGDDSITDLGDVTTVDAGIVMELTDGIQFGLTVKNLKENEIIDGADTITIGTTSRAGIAYRGNFLTLGVDIDLAETDSILSSVGKKTKMMSVGAEFDLLFAQLRLGMQKNTAEGLTLKEEEPLYTAGIGLYLGFNLDVAVTAKEDVVGGVVQAGFKF